VIVCSWHRLPENRDISPRESLSFRVLSLWWWQTWTYGCQDTGKEFILLGWVDDVKLKNQWLGLRKIEGNSKMGDLQAGICKIMASVKGTNAWCPAGDREGLILELPINQGLFISGMSFNIPRTITGADYNMYSSVQHRAWHRSMKSPQKKGKEQPETGEDQCWPLALQSCG
jgi:hypothetical protein